MSHAINSRTAAQAHLHVVAQPARVGRELGARHRSAQRARERGRQRRPRQHVTGAGVPGARHKHKARVCLPAPAAVGPLASGGDSMVLGMHDQRPGPSNNKYHMLSAS